MPKPRYEWSLAGGIGVAAVMIPLGWAVYLGGQFGLKNFQFFVNYEDIGYERSITSWDAGVGWHGLFGEPGDLVAELGYISWSPDFDGADDESGLFGRVGIRWRIIPLLELNGFVTQTEPSDSDFSDLYGDIFGKTQGQIGAVVYLGPIGLGLDLYGTSEDTGARLLIRFAFDKK